MSSWQRNDWNQQQWGRGHGWGFGGWMFFPLVMFAGAFFMLFLLLKTGLWIPLLLIGLLFYFFSPMRSRGWGQWGRRWSHNAREWSQRWQSEGWGGRDWGWGGSCDDAPNAADEKAKRETSDTTEPPRRSSGGIDYV